MVFIRSKYHISKRLTCCGEIAMLNTRVVLNTSYWNPEVNITLLLLTSRCSKAFHPVLKYVYYPIGIKQGINMFFFLGYNKFKTSMLWCSGWTPKCLFGVWFLSTLLLLPDSRGRHSADHSYLPDMHLRVHALNVGVFVYCLCWISGLIIYFKTSIEGI